MKYNFIVKTKVQSTLKWHHFNLKDECTVILIFVLINYEITKIVRSNSVSS